MKLTSYIRHREKLNKKYLPEYSFKEMIEEKGEKVALFTTPKVAEKIYKIPAKPAE